MSRILGWVHFESSKTSGRKYSGFGIIEVTVLQLTLLLNVTNDMHFPAVQANDE